MLNNHDYDGLMLMFLSFAPLMLWATSLILSRLGERETRKNKQEKENNFKLFHGYVKNKR